ncbi:NAD(P)/FAD-dependent oxidoreductase [Agromyces humatus]|uniref:FAD/NAD(P)-binding oxidoreductase n=1 Tax=Agromyces humatus TaxID=279573 RepID=A0ABN2KYX1_9MICO|nr:FAD-dependent oxidoreductase [Agromyces humatus]
MTTNVMILGAGFGGLELASLLSERLAGDVDITLVDQRDAFVFGFSKLEVLFGRRTAEQVKVPYRTMRTPGVEFRQERVLALDPATRHVVTDAGAYDPDVVVVALGADYDVAATPGFIDGGFEYYTVAGAERLRDELEAFRGGRVMLAVLSIPFKCPPAPYEAILLLHDRLVGRGIRDVTDLHVVTPQPAPIPVSPQASAALERAMGERGIEYTTRRRVYGIDPGTRVARFKDHDEPFDLFIGIPVHKVPGVLSDAGLADDGWVAVDPSTMRTGFPGVYAIGDCTETGIPKAGTFAESAAHVAADDIVRTVRGSGGLAPGGTGLCYLEFGSGQIGRVDVDFYAEGGPTAPLLGPSSDYVAEKAEFGASRRARWFGA